MGGETPRAELREIAVGAHEVAAVGDILGGDGDAVEQRTLGDGEEGVVELRRRGEAEQCVGACRRDGVFGKVVLHLRSARIEYLVPEDGLQRAEVEVGGAQEVNLVVVGTDIARVDTVHDEYLVVGELHAAHLAHEGEGHGQLNDITALHAHGAGESYILLAHGEIDLHLGGEHLGLRSVVEHFLGILHRVAGGNAGSGTRCSGGHILGAFARRGGKGYESN